MLRVFVLDVGEHRVLNIKMPTAKVQINDLAIVDGFAGVDDTDQDSGGGLFFEGSDLQQSRRR